MKSMSGHLYGLKLPLENYGYVSVYSSVSLGFYVILTELPCSLVIRYFDRLFSIEAIVGPFYCVLAIMRPYCSSFYRRCPPERVLYRGLVAFGVLPQ